MVVSAIDTLYHGCLFRSRLEARWAVFFDNLGVRYEYEKEGYKLPHGWYLPDFWLPQQDCWIEVKPDKPTNEQEILTAELGTETGKNAYIFWGQIPNPTDLNGYGMESDTGFDPNEESAYIVSPYWDNCQKWCECAICGKVGIAFEARSARLHHRPKINPFGCTDEQLAQAEALLGRIIAGTDGFDSFDADSGTLEGELGLDSLEPIYKFIKTYDCYPGQDRMHNGNSDNILGSFMAARIHRFEHDGIRRSKAGIKL